MLLWDVKRMQQILVLTFSSVAAIIERERSGLADGFLPIRFQLSGYFLDITWIRDTSKKCYHLSGSADPVR